MKRIALIVSVLIMFSISLSAQEQNLKIYNPGANAKDEISKAVEKAKAENKNILIQVGGNWCTWCMKFYNLIHTDYKIDSIIKADYIYMFVNWSKENKNTEVMKQLENPQRFGFPVIVVLNKEGKRIHTQDTGLLEHDKGYDSKKLIEFLKGWTVKAIEN